MSSSGLRGLLLGLGGLLLLGGGPGLAGTPTPVLTPVPWSQPAAPSPSPVPLPSPSPSPQASPPPPGYRFITQFDRPARIPPGRLPWKVGSPWRPDLLAQAVKIWNEAGHGVLLETESDLSRCDLVVDWSGQGLPADKASATWWEASLGYKRVKGLTLDGRMSLPDGNLVQLLAHELGHVLGLDHSDDDQDMMAARMHRRRYRSAGDPRLSERDRRALGWLLNSQEWVPIKGPREP